MECVHYLCGIVSACGMVIHCLLDRYVHYPTNWLHPLQASLKSWYPCSILSPPIPLSIDVCKCHTHNVAKSQAFQALIVSYSRKYRQELYCSKYHLAATFILKKTGKLLFSKGICCVWYLQVSYSPHLCLLCIPIPHSPSTEHSVC